jgi:hypothetical protein
MKDTNLMRFLWVIETQKVKSYLFASPIMRETRGASVLLDLLNRKKTKEILKTSDLRDYEIVYLGGGTGRILFRREEDAKKFKNEVLNIYRQKTVNARVSVEIVPREDDESFTEWMSRGVRQSQQNKLGQSKGVPILAGRWIQPCTSCGLEPAEKILHEHGEQRLCRACLLKRQEISNHLYKEIKPGKKQKWLLSPASNLSKHYTDQFIFTTLAQHVENSNYEVYLPQDFDDIGRVSRPSNYMGFIYADGNRMGEVVKNLGEKITDEEEVKIAYKAFSEIMDQATREAAVEAVWEVVDIKKDDKFRFVPAEFIMAGGDDLMLAVPGHNALDVAILFMEKFQKRTIELQREYKGKKQLSEYFADVGLTTSAGVVIAHAHYPVSDLMGLAGELMKIAKIKAAHLAETKKEQTGTLDFMILTEAGSESIKDRRKVEYTRSSNSGLEIRLTERPYTTAEARWLLTTIRALKNSKVPRSKLKALYPVLFQGPMQAQFDALRIKERLKITGDLKRSAPLKKLVTSILPIFPFREHDDNSWSTPLTEIIELYDFIQPGKDESTMNNDTLQEKEEDHD